MFDGLYGLARPLLFHLDAEKAHTAGLKSIEAAYRLGLNPLLASRPKALPQTLLGLEFPNPVGLAAGLDKNADHVDALASLGFGFIEVGTVTPLAQAGNPKPRMFRLAAHQAVINRLGFNNGGLPALMRNLERTRYTGVLGVNIGKNKDTPNERALDDYLLCLHAVYSRASYVTVNISSPNTQGLRDLQHSDALRRLLGGLRNAQSNLATLHRKSTPMLVKIAPDLSDADLDDVASVVTETGFEGVIGTNTTLSRAGIAGAHAGEAGGLSGAPLMRLATDTLAKLRQRLPDVALIGVGGITQGSDAAQKYVAGANLVQFYSGMIYRGPALIGECVEAIRAHSAAASSPLDFPASGARPARSGHAANE
jgi:dihydroorotate dehydrogenase